MFLEKKKRKKGRDIRQWFSNCGARPPGERERLERGAQHTFLEIKIKLCSPKQAHPSH
jgi:hypothetical protein